MSEAAPAPARHVTRLVSHLPADRPAGSSFQPVGSGPPMAGCPDVPWGAPARAWCSAARSDSHQRPGIAGAIPGR